MSASIMLLIIAAAVGLLYIVLRNAIVRAQQKVKAGWSSTEVQLKRRHDLVPGLLSSVSAAMRHEQGIIERIVAARSAALAALERHQPQEIANAEAALSGSLRGFFAYAEDNPEITATANITTLQRQLEDTEDQISAARRFYNSNVEAYNSLILSIPWNIVANMHGFKTSAMIEFDAAERAAFQQPVEIRLP